MKPRVIVASLVLASLPRLAAASSHREAPFISKNPKVDGTDFYAFESYEAGHAGMVTLIANYQPLEDAYGGPNYFALDPDALYEIMIDNDGDGVEDLTFQFQFSTTLGGAGAAGLSLFIGTPDAGATNAIPLYNLGLIPNPAVNGSSPSLNVLETYTVGLVRGPRRRTPPIPISTPSGGQVFQKPADNIGAKSFDIANDPLGTTTASIPSPSGYATYAASFVYSGVTVAACSASDASAMQVFVGQRAESFAVNLGPTFDLLDAPASLVTGGGSSANYAAVPNPIGAKNVTTIAIEVPRDCITASASQPVIGAWTTASIRQVRVINPNLDPDAGYTKPSREGGAWTQVSRLGNPLVNEVVIGLPDKDSFNASSPTGDVASFGTYVEYPTLPAIIDIVYGTDFQPTTFPRTDLLAAFLTGVTGLNAFPSGDGGAPIPAEYLHLNTNTEATLDAMLAQTGIAPTTYSPQAQNRLGSALCFVKGTFTPSSSGCDAFGYPNGRRPIDDVVDVALDVVEGYLLPSGNPAYQGTPTFFTDGVDQAATPFQATFPYLGTPTQGANGDGT